MFATPKGTPGACRTQPTSRFIEWVMEAHRVQYPAALSYQTSLNRLRTVASVSEILTEDLDVLVDRHPKVATAQKYRSRKAVPLRRAGRLFRGYMAAERDPDPETCTVMVAPPTRENYRDPEKVRANSRRYYQRNREALAARSLERYRAGAHA